MTTIDIPSCDAARERLSQLAFARDSLLCREARAFPRAKQDLFLATYMSMRLIDDHVDRSGADERGPESPVLGRIQRWRQRIAIASSGEVQPGESEIESDVLEVMAHTLPRSPLDDRAWDALASAMSRDARGEVLSDWDDFLAYCEGATVAPTYIFLVLLALDDGARRLPDDLPVETLWDLARPLAVFCYVAHIMRDLRKDALEGAHILTIPRELWADLAKDRQELAQRLASGSGETVQGLRSRLVERSKALEPSVTQAYSRLTGALSKTSAEALQRIMTHYSGLAGC